MNTSSCIFNYWSYCTTDSWNLLSGNQAAGRLPANSPFRMTPHVLFPTSRIASTSLYYTDSLIPRLLCTVVFRPFVYKPPLHFQSKFLHRYFYLANRPPNHGHATKIATWSSSKLLHCQIQGLHGNARTKPASTEQVRNLPSIASVFASGVNATAKDKPAECLENTTVYAVTNLCQLILAIEFLAWGTTELEARADRQLLSVCNIMFLFQHLGVAPEEGVYLQDKMSDPAYLGT